MQKGQTVYFIGSMFYGGKGLIEGEIVSAGTKYFTVIPKDGEGGEMKFNRFTLKVCSDNNYGARLYLTKKEYEDEVELRENQQHLHNYFSTTHQNLTLDQTKRILAIIQEY